MVEFTIIIGGKAGEGSAKSAEILGKVFTNQGYHVFNYRDYASIIRGGHNFNVVTVSDKPVRSHREKADYLIPLNQDALEKHEQDLKEDALVIGSDALETSKEFIKINIKKIIEDDDVERIMENVILLGSFFKIIGWKLKPLLKVLKEEFKKRFKGNKKAAKKGYEASKKVKKMKMKNGKKNYFVSGSQATALGAIKAGLDVYIAYPMTPSTPLLHELAARQGEHDYVAAQIENEIGVANAAMGASYAGALSMIGTSGGGYGLMSPVSSFQGASELPLVVYWAQRMGPGLGLPTYQAQGDLRFALNPGHGDFPKVVVAPGDAMECYTKTVEAFYLSQKYRALSIILSDKHCAESHYTYEKLCEPAVSVEPNITKKPSKNEKLYELTKNGLSPRLVPGQKALVKATSYEHDEYGYTIEDARTTAKMNDKRFRKWEELEKEVLSKLETTKTTGKGKNLVIGWGSTKGAIIDALREVKDAKFLQILYLSPFPSKKVREEMNKADKVVVVENNARGQLDGLIREKTGLRPDSKILKYDGRPFNKDLLAKKLSEVVK